MSTRAIVWFRRDLRLQDNPAWAAATRAADRITALYVLDPVLLRTAGPFRRTLLLAHLHALDEHLGRAGGRLLVRQGHAPDVVPAAANELGASEVHANADVTGLARRRDQAVSQALGPSFTRWWGNLVHPPGSVVAASGRTSRVFAPFERRWSVTVPTVWPESVPADLDADPGEGLPPVDGVPFEAPGEEAALDRLFKFVDRVDDYRATRDLPAVAGTSMLSADLRFGTVAPRTVVSVVGTSTEGRAAFVRQLAWRDWYAHLLWEVPTMAAVALRPGMDGIAWQNDPDDIAAWESGRTGYPLVDAGMRELVTTGWLHNRVRMVVASFLVKDLLVDWRVGERWFRRLLVDADIPQNAGNWQWVAGTGPDAAPFFRVFNPVAQSQRFDPDGTYIRRFVPEVARLPARWIHAPWTAPPSELTAAGIVLGDTYPRPVVDHATARERALDAYRRATRTGR